MPFHSRNDLLVRTKDGRNCVLEEPLVFVSESGGFYRAPAGTETDGASTPAEMWLGLPPFGDYWLAAVLHDAAYRGTLEQQTTEGNWVRAMLPKGQCDNLLLEAMMSLDVPETTRTAIYEGVRFAGWRAFREDRG